MRLRPPPEPTTALLCILCIIITLAHTTTRATDGTIWSHLGHFTDVSPMDVWNGHYSPLFTNMFLHADFTQGLGITHLVFDVIMLYQLGCFVEVSIGPVWYMLFVAASAIVGSCVELAWSGNIGIGASGVVYALFGLMWAGRQRYPDWQAMANPYNMRVMIGWGVYCIFATYTHMMQVANGAHFGGLLFGFCIGKLFIGLPSQGVTDRALRVPFSRWIWAGPLAIVLTICAIGLTWVPWSAEWWWWKGNKAFAAKNYVASAMYYERSVRHGAGPNADDAWNNIAAAWHNQAIADVAKKDMAAAERDLLKEADAAAKSHGEYKLDQ